MWLPVHAVSYEELRMLTTIMLLSVVTLLMLFYFRRGE